MHQLFFLQILINLSERLTRRGGSASGCPARSIGLHPAAPQSFPISQIPSFTSGISAIDFAIGICRNNLEQLSSNLHIFLSEKVVYARIQNCRTSVCIGISFTMDSRLDPFYLAL